MFSIKDMHAKRAYPGAWGHVPSENIFFNSRIVFGVCSDITNK